MVALREVGPQDEDPIVVRMGVVMSVLVIEVTVVVAMCTVMAMVIGVTSPRLRQQNHPHAHDEEPRSEAQPRVDLFR